MWLLALLGEVLTDDGRRCSTNRYQRWLYPTDKRRANEYGIAYEREGEAEKPKEELKEEPAAADGGGSSCDSSARASVGDSAGGAVSNGSAGESKKER